MNTTMSRNLKGIGGSKKENPLYSPIYRIRIEGSKHREGCLLGARQKGNGINRKVGRIFLGVMKRF